MEKELCIIEFIKKQRYLSKAIKRLLSPKERLELKEKTRYLVIDPDKESDEEEDSDKSQVEKQNSLEQKKLELSSGHFSKPSESVSEMEIELAKAEEYVIGKNEQA